MIYALWAVTAILFALCLFLLNERRKLSTYNLQLHSESARYKRLQEEFLANMSHELRTPVTALKGFTELISEWATEDHLQPRYIEALEIMKRNESFLLDMVNSILNFSKLKSGVSVAATIDDVDVKELMGDIISLFQIEAQKKNLKLNLEINPNVPTRLRIHAQTMKQILINLIQNAVKFTESGGVAVRVAFHELMDASAGEIVVDVTDSGIGIEAKELPNIFRAFYQAESTASRSYGGTGLGLAVSKMLAGNVEGNIEVQSEFGHGSKFRVTLPTRTSKSQNVERPLDSLGADDTRPKRILIVEDSPDSRKVIQAFLKKFEPEIHIAENGREAVQLALEAEKASAPFDVILMDMQMPVMSGFQATRILRQRGFQKPIVAVTAHNLQGDREKCLEAGCSDYIPKPLDAQIFRNKIRELIAS